MGSVFHKKVHFCLYSRIPKMDFLLCNPRNFYHSPKSLIQINICFDLIVVLETPLLILRRRRSRMRIFFDFLLESRSASRSFFKDSSLGSFIGVFCHIHFWRKNRKIFSSNNIFGIIPKINPQIDSN